MPRSIRFAGAPKPVVHIITIVTIITIMPIRIIITINTLNPNSESEAFSPAKSLVLDSRPKLGYC